MHRRFNPAEEGEQKPEDLLFHQIPGPRPWGSVSFSACVHALVITAGASYLHFLALLPIEPMRENREARVLDLSAQDITAPILRAPSLKSDPAPGPKELPTRPRETKAAEALSAPSGPAAPARAARPFKMPPVTAQKSAPQTLVQLDLPPTLDVRQEQRVPAIVMLSSSQRKLAKPFLAPPQRKQTMEIPSRVELETRVPVLELHPGFAKTPEVLSPTPPRLAAPVGAVTPVASNRDPKEIKPNAATVTGTAPSETANVISLPDRPIPVASAIFLPALNQAAMRDSVAGSAGPMDPAGGRALVGASGTGEVSGKAPNGSDAAGATGSGHGAGGANLGGTGAGSTNAGHGAGSNGAGAGNGKTGEGLGGHQGNGGGGGAASSGTGSGTNGAGGGLSAGNGPGNAGGSENGTSTGSVPPPVRLVRPHTGNYEVAVVQSSGVVPGSAGLLKGKPVYSVYIPVVGRREWILQYCSPPEPAHDTEHPQVVELSSVPPLKAPYAYLIFGPIVHLREGARYGFIHGFVNKSGRFEQLTEASDPVIENLDSVLESLKQWEFRPATKDGVPAMVEVLLCIPNVV